MFKRNLKDLTTSSGGTAGCNLLSSSVKRLQWCLYLSWWSSYCAVLTYLGCWNHGCTLGLVSFHSTNVINNNSINILTYQVSQNSVHAHHSYRSSASYDEAEGSEGEVVSCEGGVSSSLVWGQGAAVCEPQPCIPAGVPAPPPVAARRTAAPLAGHSAAQEGCSSLQKESHL